MAIARKLPIGYYVYAITVDGVVRYIGKGKDLRLYCHRLRSSASSSTIKAVRRFGCA